MKKIYLFLIILFAVNGVLGQTTIASWGFEGVTTSNTGTAPILTAGSATADAGALTAGSAFSALHTSATSVWSNPSGNGSTKSLSSNGWGIGDYYQFLFKTTGYSSISITWDEIGSGTGPRDFKVQYSTDGTTFTDATGTNSTYLVLNTPAWAAATPQPAHTRSLDLSTVMALNNQATVYIRLVNTSLVSTSGNAVATTGTGRVDDFKAIGTSTTAAGVSVSGRVKTAEGRGIANARITVTGNSLAQPISVITGRRGFYNFEDLQSGETYIVTVGSRRFTFSSPSRVLSLVDNITDEDFVADPMQ